MQEAKEPPSRRIVSGVYGIQILGMAQHDLDALPYGVIKLDRRGVVMTFNAYEERASQKARGEVVGKRFFHEVAPCTQVDGFYDRFLEGVAKRSLNTTFGFAFPLPQGDRHVLVTLFYQTADESVWVVLRDTCAPVAG